MNENGGIADSAELKPPWGLVICSLLVLVTCIVFMSMGIAAFAAWDPCTWISGAFFAVASAVLAREQYRGIYRRNSQAARRAAIFLFLIGGGAIFIFSSALGELLVHNLPLPWKSLLLPALGVAGTAFLAGWINWRWSRRLARGGVQRIQGGSWLGLLPSERWIGAGTLICVVLLTAYFIKTTPPRCAEHVSGEDAPFALPPSARDVSYCQGYRGTKAFEFTTDEQSFVVWVDSGIGSLESDAANHSVKEITSPLRIRRYHALDPESDKADYVVVKNGLAYRWSKEDRGVYATFDRMTGRAYYFAHFY